MLKQVTIVISLLLIACSQTDDPLALFAAGDYKKSYAIWMTRAGQGDAEAQNYIAIHYYLGLGQRRDFQKALAWFEKAAKKGFADAQYNLGGMYENGEYVKKDYFQAYMWLFAAHNNGNPHAAKRLIAIASEHKLLGNQVTYAEAQGKKYIKK